MRRSLGAGARRAAAALLAVAALSPGAGLADGGVFPPPGVPLYRGGEAVVDADGSVDATPPRALADSPLEVGYVYTKDAADAVAAFYRRAFGRAPVPGRKFLLGRDDTGEFAGVVNLYLVIETARARQGRSIREDTLFEPLDAIVTMTPDRPVRERAGAIRRKYAHLSRAWFPAADVEEMLEACRQGERQAAERRMRALQMRLMQGRATEREIAQLGDVRAQRLASLDFWEGCYRNIEGHAYPVRIAIMKSFAGRFTPAGGAAPRR